MPCSDMVGYQYFRVILLPPSSRWSEGTKIFQNTSILQHRYTASQPRKPWPELHHCQNFKSWTNCCHIQITFTILSGKEYLEICHTHLCHTSIHHS